MRRRWALALSALALIAVSAAAQRRDEIRTPERYRRSLAYTYLTFPEWFLVYSPEEYANTVEREEASRFPFVGHVGQIWGGYATIASAIPEDVPPDYAYHGMVWVIAGSTTAEYAVRAAYESVIGRVTEATVAGERTHEDRLGADVAREYERFLRQRAWYDFDYAGALRRLWVDTPFTWRSPLRALERRYALTSEYLFKLAYAQLLRGASDATWEGEDFSERTVVLLEREAPRVEVIERYDDGAVLAALPRYEAFTPASLALARAGAAFLEIAGNTGPILVSARVPAGHDPGARVLLRQPILTSEGRERVVLEVPVAGLSGLLRELEATEAVELEHVYDY